MTGYVEILNHWGENFWAFAWPMLWQSSVLIAVILAIDLLFARRIRASVRCALWMVVLVKLILPPTLALPTGATWWLWRAHPAVLPPAIQNYTVSFGNTVPEEAAPTAVPVILPPPKLSWEVWALLAAAAMAAALLLWLAFRWLRVAGNVRRAATAPAELDGILEEARKLARLRGRPRLKLIDDAQSPAVYGLFRPVILLPRMLANRISVCQLQAVLLHEAVHLRRGDVWMNFAQTLLQIAYWWHPLLWIANARIRRVREEAVDDAVMLALRDGADAYAPTLLEVAKFAFRRPLASLGLVGILESRSALRQRVERLVDFRPPRKPGITFLSMCGIIAFSAVALPMAQGPAADAQSASSAAENATNPANQKTLTEVFAFQNPIREKDLQQLLLQAGVNTPPTICIYLKDGRLLARGTDDQLADIRHVVLKLNGHSNIPRGKAPNKRVAVLRQTTHVINTNPVRKALLDKLNSIHLDVSYENEPLSQVLRDLNRQSVEFDPDKKGINFLFNPHVGPDSSINPATGLPMNAFVGNPAAPQMVDATNININLSLNNVSLPDVLNAICLVSDRPIKYSIEDYGVVFSEKDTNSLPYEMRTFRVNPTVFYSNLRENASGDAVPGGGLGQISRLASEFFTRLGVDLSPPKSVFYNDRLGVLFVYAPPQDLDVIEKAVQALNEDPPMIHVKARFIEVPQEFFLTAIASSLFPGLTNGGVLPNREFQTFLHEAESQHGSEEFAEPEVTTINGRRIKMHATAFEPVVTNYIAKPIPTTVDPDGLSISPEMTQVETGPILDLIPSVSADGYSIGLNVTAEMKQFFGYASPQGLPTSYATNSVGEKIPMPTSLPAIQLIRAQEEKTVYDGQTLVLFPKPAQLLYAGSDQKRVEIIARDIQQCEKDPNVEYGDKVILVFVTATLIDPVGNRLHSDDEMSFAQTTVPPKSP